MKLGQLFSRRQLDRAYDKAAAEPALAVVPKPAAKLEGEINALCETYAGMSADDPNRPELQRQIVDFVSGSLKEYEDEATLAAKDIRRLQERKAYAERRTAEIEKAVIDAMEFAGEKELRGQWRVLKLAKKPASVLITDPERIPAGFRTIVPASWTPNKVEIAKALKAGKAVDGADLSEGNMRLVVE